MAEGTIKKLTDKGFGFIKTGSDKDLFFHSNGPPRRQFRGTAGRPKGVLYGRPESERSLCRERHAGLVQRTRRAVPC